MELHLAGSSTVRTGKDPEQCTYERLNAQRMMEGPDICKRVYSLDPRALTGRTTGLVAMTVHVGAQETDVVATLDITNHWLVCLVVAGVIRDSGHVRLNPNYQA